MNTKKRIFIVEDEAVLALELKDHLVTAGYDVCGHAMRGDAALQQIPEAQPDLILMDINLGGGTTGLDVAERLRPIMDVPVIFLTAYSDTKLTDRASLTGSFAYIVKPFEPHVLRANIEPALVRHNATIALRASEERFRRVLNHISDALIVDDIEGRVVFANDRFCDLFGVSREQLPNTHLEDYVAPPWRARLRDRHNRRLAGEPVPTEFEYEGLRSDGSTIWIEVSVVLVHGEDGAIVGTQSALRDITARKQREEQLELARFTIVGRWTGSPW